MKVFVLGSCRHLDENGRSKFARACCDLGHQLAVAGHSIIVCSAKEVTADPHIVRGLKGTGATLHLYRPRSAQEMVPGSVFPELSPDNQENPIILNSVFTGGGYRVAHLRAIRDTDVLLALGGGISGTSAAIYSAELLNTPVVLVPTFGGAAQEAWGYFHGRYYRDEEVELLGEQWADDGSWAKGIVEAISSISRRRPLERAFWSETFPTGIATLLAIGIWFWTFFGEQSYFPSHLRLFILLSCSAITGASLNALMTDKGYLRLEYGARNTFRYIVSGLALGFGFLLLSEGLNYALSGELLQLDNKQDLLRIGGILSGLVFVASLKPEAALHKLLELGKKIIQET